MFGVSIPFQVLYGRLLNVLSASQTSEKAWERCVVKKTFRIEFGSFLRVAEATIEIRAKKMRLGYSRAFLGLSFLPHSAILEVRLLDGRRG